MVSRHFLVQLAGRLLLFALLTFLAVWLVLRTGYHGWTLMVLVSLALLAVELWRYTSRTNRELSRFLNAARYADFSQKFSLEPLGSDFGKLGQVFNEILERQRNLRIRQEAGNRHLRALIEHIPVPLMTVHADGALSLQNNAARRLFGAAHVTRLEDLKQFGENFHDSVEQAVPGLRELVTFSVEDVEYRLTLASTEIISEGKSERLISLQDIQNELDETQAQAWQELVSVLTHEIMNSITPVSSLAETAKEVVDDVLEKSDPDNPAAEDLEDLREAVTTLAQRSDSLMNFVNGYRQITRLAPPRKERISLVDLFESASRLARAEWPDGELNLVSEVSPPGLDIQVDRDLLEPVLLNLLRNAWQAAIDVDHPQIQLLGRLNRRGRAVIEVRDNGPGVPDENKRKIFVPFFTTKEGGSGVGLALARQVMIAHGGFIRVSRNEEGGASFTMTF